MMRTSSLALAAALAAATAGLALAAPAWGASERDACLAAGQRTLKTYHRLFPSSARAGTVFDERIGRAQARCWGADPRMAMNQIQALDSEVRSMAAGQTGLTPLGQPVPLFHPNDSGYAPSSRG